MITECPGSSVTCFSSGKTIAGDGIPRVRRGTQKVYVDTTISQEIQYRTIAQTRASI
jgi:hypothetical protein